MGTEQKKLFVHCGLHKTGTTALQKTFLEKSEDLRKHGLLYPKAGRLDTLGGGHHAIAWQLTYDRRYNPDFGGIAELLEELGGFDGDAVISSEDFETLLETPADMGRLVDALRPSGREIIIVIYLRNQLSYCQSIFIENIGQNIGTDYLAYVREVGQHGRLRLRDWVFHFDYMRLMTCVEAMPVRVVFRNVHVLEGNSVIPDFLRVVGVKPEYFKDRWDSRANQVDSPAQWLVPFLVTRLGRALGEFERQAVEIIKGLIGVRHFVSRPETEKKFLSTFSLGNTLLCARYGLPDAGLNMQTNAIRNRDAIVTYEDIFSFEMQCLLYRMRNQMRAGKTDVAAAMARHFIVGANNAVLADKS